MVFLRERGIQTSIHYPPVHNFSFHRRYFKSKNLQLTEYIADHELTLPMYPGIKDEQIDFITGNLLAYFQKK